MLTVALLAFGAAVGWYFLVPVEPPVVVVKRYLEAERSQNQEAVAKCLRAEEAEDYRKLPKAESAPDADLPTAFTYGRTRYARGTCHRGGEGHLLGLPAEAVWTARNPHAGGAGAGTAGVEGGPGGFYGGANGGVGEGGRRGSFRAEIEEVAWWM